LNFELFFRVSLYPCIIIFLSIAFKGPKREAKKYSKLHHLRGSSLFTPLVKFGFSRLKILSPLFKKAPLEKIPVDNFWQSWYIFAKRKS